MCIRDRGSAGNGIHLSRLLCQHLGQQRQSLLIVGLILAGSIQHRNIGHFSVLDGHRYPDDIAKDVYKRQPYTISPLLRRNAQPALFIFVALDLTKSCLLQIC